MSMSTSRRRVGATGAAMLTLAAVLLAACSSGETADESQSEATADESGDAEPADSGSASEGSSGEGTSPEDIEFFFSAGEAPAEPQRVLALWRTGSSLAELGVVPVGSLEGEFLDSELTPEQFAPVADLPTVGSYEGVSIEDVIALEPDLVVGMDHGGLSINYEELAEVYPVRILQIHEPTDVWDNYADLASLVGKSVDFEDARAALDARLADLNTEHGEALGALTATSIGSTGGSIWVDTSKALSYRHLTEAGFGYNAAYTDNPERYVTELSRENIPTLADQDVIFYDAEINGSTSPDVQSLLDEPAFQELPAVKEGRLFPLRGATVYTFTAQNLMVDDIEAAAAALTGAES
ncbi:ABC transporter substrate-binding protein [Salana multivorans]